MLRRPPIASYAVALSARPSNEPYTRPCAFESLASCHPQPTVNGGATADPRRAGRRTRRSPIPVPRSRPFSARRSLGHGDVQGCAIECTSVDSTPPWQCTSDRGHLVDNTPTTYKLSWESTDPSRQDSCPVRSHGSCGLLKRSSRGNPGRAVCCRHLPVVSRNLSDITFSLPRGRADCFGAADSGKGFGGYATGMANTWPATSARPREARWSPPTKRAASA